MDKLIMPSSDHNSTNPGTIETHPETTYDQQDYEMMDLKEKNLQHELYIGDLKWWTNEEDITKIIDEIGIKDFEFKKFFEYKYNGVSKGVCAVSFGSEDSINRAIDKLPKKEFNGKKLVVLRGPTERTFGLPQDHIVVSNLIYLSESGSNVLGSRLMNKSYMHSFNMGGPIQSLWRIHINPDFVRNGRPLDISGLETSGLLYQYGEHFVKHNRCFVSSAIDGPIIDANTGHRLQAIGTLMTRISSREREQRFRRHGSHRDSSIECYRPYGLRSEHRKRPHDVLSCCIDSKPEQNENVRKRRRRQ